MAKVITKFLVSLDNNDVELIVDALMQSGLIQCATLAERIKEQTESQQNAKK